MYPEKTLPYSYPNSMTHVLKFDSKIDTPDYYSEFCDVLLQATENDVVEIYFSTVGGNGSSMITLLNLLGNCKAETHGFLMSEAHSAGSYLFLACDKQYVGRFTSMLLHQASYGTGGSHHEVKAYVDHVAIEERDLVTTVYKHFLSDEEIEQLMQGRQIYLYETDIASRLEARDKAFEQEQIEAQKQASADMEAMFDELDPPVPEAILKKLTKQQLIDYIAGKVDIHVNEDGTFEVMEIIPEDEIID